MKPAMNFRTVAFAVLGIAAIGLAFRAIVSQSVSNGLTERSGFAIQAHVEPNSGAPLEVAGAAEPDPLLPTAAFSPAILADANEMMQRAKRSSEVTDRLLVMAQSGDRSAVLALDDMLERCMPFTGDLRSRATPQAPEGTIQRKQQIAAIEAGIDFCDDARLSDGIAFKRLIEATARSRFAGEKNAPRMRLERLPPAEAATAAASVLASSVERRDVERASAAILRAASSRDSAVIFLEGAPPIRPDGSRELLDLVAIWVSCERSRSCAPGSNFVVAECLYRNNCAIELEQRDFIRDRAASPDDYRQILDLVRWFNVNHPVKPRS